MAEPNTLGARAAARAIAARRLSAEALVASCLEQIAAREPVVGAWHYVDRDRAPGVDPPSPILHPTATLMDHQTGFALYRLLPTQSHPSVMEDSRPC